MLKQFCIEWVNGSFYLAYPDHTNHLLKSNTLSTSLMYLLLGCVSDFKAKLVKVLQCIKRELVSLQTRGQNAETVLKSLQGSFYEQFLFIFEMLSR